MRARQNPPTRRRKLHVSNNDIVSMFDGLASTKLNIESHSAPDAHIYTTVSDMRTGEHISVTPALHLSGVDKYVADAISRFSCGIEGDAKLRDEVDIVIKRAIKETLDDGDLTPNTLNIIAKIGARRSTAFSKSYMLRLVKKEVDAIKLAVSDNTPVNIGAYMCFEEEGNFHMPESGRFEYDAERMKILDTKDYVSGDLICCPIAVSKSLIDIDDGSTYFKMVYKHSQFCYPGSQNRHLTISMKDLFNQKSCADIMNSAGVGITHDKSKHAVEYFQQLINNNNEIEKGNMAHRLGWYQGDLIPYERPDIELFDNSGNDMHKWYSSRGTLAQEIANIEKAVAYSPKITPLIMGAAVGSLITSYAEHLDGVNANAAYFLAIYGESDIGKTVITSMVSSMFGNPNMLMDDANATKQALAKTCAYINSMPIFLDDPLNNANKTTHGFMSDVYGLTAGKGRARLHSDGQLQHNQDRWKCNVIVTNEESFSVDGVKAGAENRMLQVEFDEPVSPQRCRELVEARSKDYGNSALPIVRMIKNLGIEGLNKMRESLKHQLDESFTLNGKQTSIAENIAMGFEVAKMALGLNGIELDYAFLLSHVKSKKEVSETWMAANEMHAFLRTQTDLFKNCHTNDGTFVGWVNTMGKSRPEDVRMSERCLYIMEDTLKTFCSKKELQLVRVLAGAKTMGVLDDKHVIAHGKVKPIAKVFPGDGVEHMVYAWHVPFAITKPRRGMYAASQYDDIVDDDEEEEYPF